MKIVAIGGGNLRLGDTAKPYNLEEVNEEIVKLSSKKCPRLLYIGFNIRADFYFSQIKTIFAGKGCQCIYLRFNEFKNQKTIESKIRRADIIFLPGGNTLEYMKKIRKFGLDKYLETAAERNCVMAGISAGAIMCFDAGCSDSRKNDIRYSKVCGMGLARGLIAPHFSESGRVADLPRMLKICKKNTIAFGIDECAALIINGNSYKIIKSNKDSNIFKCFFYNNIYNQIKIENNGNIEELYRI